MSTTKETMKVIAQGIPGKTDCPIIRGIAKRSVELFEEAAEYEFENEEDLFIRDLLLRLYLKGDYWEAIGLLTLSFSLVDMNAAGELIAQVGSCTYGNVGKEFLEMFLEGCGIRPIQAGSVKSSPSLS